MNPLPDRSNYSPLCHTPLPHSGILTTLFSLSLLVSSGQTLYQAASWRLILQSSLLQRFTAESSRELSALRKLNNKQRQVSMFLILLFKLLTQFPFVSSLCSLSQSSALTSRIWFSSDPEILIKGGLSGPPSLQIVFLSLSLSPLCSLSQSSLFSLSLFPLASVPSLLAFWSIVCTKINTSCFIQLVYLAKRH